MKKNPELAHNKDCFLKKLKISLTLYMHVIYLPSYFWMLLREKKRFAAEQLTLLGSVELPKTTHLPKTTENHLENHIYRGIIPSLYLFLVVYVYI